MVATVLFAGSCTTQVDQKAVGSPPPETTVSTAPPTAPPVTAEIVLADSDLDIVEACIGEAAITQPLPDEIGIVDDPSGSRLCVGPIGAAVMMESVSTEPGFGDGWAVRPVFSEPDIDLFNQLAKICFARDDAYCPTGRLAIMLNGAVLSAPSINAASFARDMIVISGRFSVDDAQSIAEEMGGGAVGFRPVLLELGPPLDLDG